LNGRVGQGIAEFGEGRAADFLLIELEFVAKSVGHLFEDTHGLRRYFGTDPVTGEGSDREAHETLVS
jgi:hypothetical protein